MTAARAAAGEPWASESSAVPRRGLPADDTEPWADVTEPPPWESSGGTSTPQPQVEVVPFVHPESEITRRRPVLPRAARRPRRATADWYQPEPASTPHPASIPTAPPAIPPVAAASPRRSASDNTGDPAATNRRPRRVRRDNAWGLILEVTAIIVIGLLVTSVLRAFVFQLFEVPSGSMENTLQVNDKIVAQRIAGIQRGDVVVFADANGWLSGRYNPGPVRRVFEFVGILPNSGDGHLVKRVIGMPGDRVRCCDAEGRLTVNGYALDESAYLYADGSGMVEPADVPFEVIVPEGHMFVVGDHRNASGDSRCHLQSIPRQGGEAGSAAFVPLDAVVGSVPLIISPLHRLQRLHRPEVYSGVPPPEQPAPAEPQIIHVEAGC